jgi:hypothetical protein
MEGPQVRLCGGNWVCYLPYLFEIGRLLLQVRSKKVEKQQKTE